MEKWDTFHLVIRMAIEWHFCHFRRMPDIDNNVTRLWGRGQYRLIPERFFNRACPHYQFFENLKFSNKNRFKCKYCSLSVFRSFGLLFFAACRSFSLAQGFHQKCSILVRKYILRTDAVLYGSLPDRYLTFPFGRISSKPLFYSFGELTK